LETQTHVVTPVTTQVVTPRLRRTVSSCVFAKPSDQAVGNVLHRHGLPPAPERKGTTTWATFIRTHLALLAWTDFFGAEVLTLRGPVTYVLFFIHLESRRVDIAGLTVRPDEPWMKPIARHSIMEDCGALRHCHYLLHDRDTKFTRSFRTSLRRFGSNRSCCLRAART
jgi:putative transposase